MNDIWQEQITREATKSGNGAHVFVPKEWAGERIVLLRQPKYSASGILQLLEPHLTDIEGVFIFGSRARGEARDGADIDLLVITGRKVDIHIPGHHVIAATKEQFGRLFQLEPLLLSAALAEAAPVINAGLLAELRKSFPPAPSLFRPFIKETERVIAIHEGIPPVPSSAAYSLIFRLRGVYIIRDLLTGRPYSHKLFRLWLHTRMPDADSGVLFDAYQAVKEKRRPPVVSRKDAVAALRVLKEETKTLRKELHDKQKKAPAKRH